MNIQFNGTLKINGVEHIINLGINPPQVVTPPLVTHTAGESEPILFELDGNGGANVSLFANPKSTTAVTQGFYTTISKHIAGVKTDISTQTSATDLVVNIPTLEDAIYFINQFFGANNDGVFNVSKYVKVQNGAIVAVANNYGFKNVVQNGNDFTFDCVADCTGQAPSFAIGTGDINSNKTQLSSNLTDTITAPSNAVAIYGGVILDPTVWADFNENTIDVASRMSLFFVNK